MDRVCVVTGGAGENLGSAICRMLARNGWVVWVADRDRSAATQLADEIDGHPLELNVADARSVARGFSTVIEHGGRLDGLVNSAAMQIERPVADLSDDDFDGVIETDLRGPWLCARAALPALVRAGNGVIVNVSSAHAVGADPGFGAYAAAKAGLGALSRAIAMEYGRDGVRCNVVLPGLTIRPPITEPWIDEFVETSQMLKRIIEPDDVASLVAYLMSDAARAITGASIPVDAGSTAMLFADERDARR